MKQDIIIDSKTGQQKGELVCDIFPRKRGYEVVCVLQKTGKEPTFASHGVYMNKPAAENAIEHVFGAMRTNPKHPWEIGVAPDEVSVVRSDDGSRVSRFGWVKIFKSNGEWKVQQYDDSGKAITYIAQTDTKPKAVRAAKEWAQKQIDREFLPDFAAKYGKKNPLVESIITGAGLGIGLFGIKRLFNGKNI